MRFGLALVFVLALGVRALGFERVFPEDGSVVFAAGDAYYHVRRALFGAVHFPSVLQFDPCLNWPDGARVPHPPGYSFGLAALARLLTGNLASAQVLLAWVPTVFGALCVLPVAALARTLGGRGMALGAALLYATLPIAASYAAVGNPDHHAAASFFGASAILLYARLLDPACTGRRLVWTAAGLAAVRVALMLTWHGSALYLPIGEAALILAFCATHRRDALLADAASALASAACLAPFVLLSPAATAGAFSATELSGLHLLGLASIAGLCLAGVALQRLRPMPSALGRTLRITGVAGALGALALAIPEIREGLLHALDFVAKRDDWGDTVQEQLPLFFFEGRLTGLGGLIRMGGFAFLIPLVPVAFALLDRRPALRNQARFLCAWSLLLAALALYQMRFANDFAPVACVGFALLLSMAAEGLAAHTRLSRPSASVLAWVVGGALALPSFALALTPLAAASLSHLAGSPSPHDRALDSIAGTQFRFAQRVYDSTPVQPGCRPYDSREERPHYGVLAHPALGHVLHLVAERPTPADPFGPYIGDANYRKVIRFLAAPNEADALALAADLKTPFVATAAGIGSRADFPMDHRLHQDDGSAAGDQPHLERFRLITESSLDGVPIAQLFGRSDVVRVPYKLFEIVAGAPLEIRATPGVVVEASLRVTTWNRRGFFYRARGRAGSDGWARIRVAYASGARGDVATADAYELRSGDWRGRALVSEEAVTRGLPVRVGAEDEAPPSTSTLR
jgi:asparagine N-glycosylation enzyme membrane subunit Stt3